MKNFAEDWESGCIMALQAAKLPIRRFASTMALAIKNSQLQRKLLEWTEATDEAAQTVSAIRQFFQDHSPQPDRRAPLAGWRGP